MPRDSTVVWSTDAPAERAHRTSVYAVYITASLAEGTLHGLFQARDNGRLGLFGGGLRQDEAPDVGLMREIEEEMGPQGLVETLAARRVCTEYGACDQRDSTWVHRDLKIVTTFLVDAPGPLVVAAVSAAVTGEGSGAVWLPMWTRVTEPYWLARAPALAARHNFEFPAWHATVRAVSRIAET